MRGALKKFTTAIDAAKRAAELAPPGKRSVALELLTSLKRAAKGGR